jgi:hypothetical protein
MTLTREAILGAQDIKTEDVRVPEWGGSVRIGVMSGTARDAFLAGRERNSSLSCFQAAMLAATIIDPGGKRLFTEADIEALQEKNGQVLGRLADVAFRINAIGPAADDAAAKNSETDQSGASGSGSHETSVKASGKFKVK